MYQFLIIAYLFTLHSPAIDKTLECMCLVAFYGLLRCSGFTVRSLKAPYCFLKIIDVEFSKDKSMFTLFLASSKTDPFRKGSRVQFFKNELLCPVSCMNSFLKSYRRKPILSNAPLFVDMNNQSFSREVFISYPRDILTRLGYDKDVFCDHSFRKRSASAMAAGVFRTI